MNPDPRPTNLADLTRAQNHANPAVRRAVMVAIDEIETLRRAAVDLEEENKKLRVRIEELERHADWNIDMIVGDAYICRIEGKYDDIADLLGNAVGKQIQSYEIDNPHHEDSFDPARPDQR